MAAIFACHIKILLRTLFCEHCFACTVLRTLFDNITSGKVFILYPLNLWRRYLRTLFCVHCFAYTVLRTLCFYSRDVILSNMSSLIAQDTLFVEWPIADSPSEAGAEAEGSG